MAIQFPPSVPDVLGEPFQRQRMSQSLGFRQTIGRAADGSKLKTLGALIVEKRDLLITGAARPTAGHDIRHRADVWIVDRVKWRSRYFLFLLGVAGDITEHAIAAGGDLRSRTVGEQRRGSKPRDHVSAFEHIRSRLIIT